MSTVHPQPQPISPLPITVANAARVRAASAKVTERAATNSRVTSSPPQLAVRWASQAVGQGVRTVTSERNVTSSYSRSLSPKGSVQTNYGNNCSPQPVQTTYGNRSCATVVGNSRSVAAPVKQDDAVSRGKLYSTSPASKQRSPLYRPVQTSYGCPPSPRQSLTQFVTRSARPSLSPAEEEVQVGGRAGLPFSVSTYRRSGSRSPAPYSRNRDTARTIRLPSPPPCRSPPEQRSVECKVLLTARTHNCSLQLAPDTSVDEAISQATRQVLRNVVESRGELGPIGEHISVTPLPSANGATTVGEWARRNLGHAPAVVVKSNESDWESPRRTEVGQEDSLRHLQDAHAEMMASLQELLQGQTRTIERQATFIDDLQERERQSSKLFCGSIARIKVDIADLKGDFLNLEEQMTPSENGQQNSTMADRACSK